MSKVARLATISILFLANLTTFNALAAETDNLVNASYTMVTPSNLKWKKAPQFLPKGAKIAYLAGDPNHDAAYTIRLKLPANYQIQAHCPTAMEYLTVISGTIYMGAGNKLDTNASRALPAGSFVALPKGVSHYLWTKEKTIIQIHGNHKWNIKYVESANDPRNLTPQENSAVNTEF